MENTKIQLGEAIKRKLSWWMVLSVVVFGLVLGLFYWKKGDSEMLNPWTGRREDGLKVVGFLPTWMVGKTKLYTTEIDELVFLGIEANSSGELVWDSNAKKIYAESFLKQKKEIKKHHGKTIIGIKLFRDKDLDELMANQESKKKLAVEIKRLVDEENFDGVNLDFEWQGDPLAVTRQEMASFSAELRKVGVNYISIDVFANTIIKGGKESLERLTEMADQVIVMAYDFHGAGSKVSGSVAPIGALEGKRSIGEVVGRIGDLGLDPKKFILAYPLYGYEWKTESDEIGASTIAGWSQMASLARMTQLVNDHESGVASLENFKKNYDEVSKTPWLAWTEYEKVDKTVWVKKRKSLVTETIPRIHQVHYDDLTSLKIKIDLARENGVAGVGFWALGYEGDIQEIWKLVY